MHVIFVMCVMYVLLLSSVNGDVPLLPFKESIFKYTTLFVKIKTVPSVVYFSRPTVAVGKAPNVAKGRLDGCCWLSK
jgi:hypothetical protein